MSTCHHVTFITWQRTLLNKRRKGSNQIAENRLRNELFLNASWTDVDKIKAQKRTSKKSGNVFIESSKRELQIKALFWIFYVGLENRKCNSTSALSKTVVASQSERRRRWPDLTIVWPEKKKKTQSANHPVRHRLWNREWRHRELPADSCLTFVTREGK